MITFAPQISFQHVSDEDGNGKSWLVASKSFDNLNDVHKEKTIEKKKGGMNIFSKIFKARTLQSPSRKKTKQKSKKKSNRSSLADGVTPSPNEGESSLASSMSMPDIACKFVYHSHLVVIIDDSGSSM